MELVYGLMLVVALVLSAYAMYTLKESYTRVGVDRTYKIPKDVHVPGTPHSNPVSRFMSGIVDPTLPPEAPGQAAEYTKAEIDQVVQRVIDRINTRHPDARLAVVNYDNVKKMVDAYKTVHYEVDVHVHSVTGMYSSRLTARVDVTPSGKEFVRDIRVHNASKDTSGLGSATVSGLEAYAAFEPAVKYPHPLVQRPLAVRAA